MSSCSHYSHLSRAGAELKATSKNFKKQQMSFVLRLPDETGLDRIVTEVGTIADGLRGIPDWPD